MNPRSEHRALHAPSNILCSLVTVVYNFYARPEDVHFNLSVRRQLQGILDREI